MFVRHLYSLHALYSPPSPPLPLIPPLRPLFLCTHKAAARQDKHRITNKANPTNYLYAEHIVRQLCKRRKEKMKLCSGFFLLLVVVVFVFLSSNRSVQVAGASSTDTTPHGVRVSTATRDCRPTSTSGDRRSRAEYEMVVWERDLQRENGSTHVYISAAVSGLERQRLERAWEHTEHTTYTPTPTGEEKTRGLKCYTLFFSPSMPPNRSHLSAINDRRPIHLVLATKQHSRCRKLL